MRFRVGFFLLNFDNRGDWRLDDYLVGGRPLHGLVVVHRSKSHVIADQFPDEYDETANNRGGQHHQQQHLVRLDIPPFHEIKYSQNFGIAAHIRLDTVWKLTASSTCRQPAL